MQNVHDKGTRKKKDGVVYTEDGVPVYTLYLGIGEVKTVHVITKQRKSPHDNPFQYGFVTFAKPVYAAKTLNIRSHVRLARHLKVKPADTWKQPKIAHESIQSSASGENDQTDNSNDDTPENADQMSILELNDDCLCHIFSFLSQKEALKLAFVCQRFFNIIEHRIKVSKFFDFNGMHENFTLMETRQILSSFGDHIKRLRLGRANDKNRRYIEFISLYCRHLEEIEFTSFSDIHFDTYKRIFRSARQLKSVTLNDCDLTDSVCSLLNALTELESLDVSHNHEITGKSLKNLKSLKQLNLSNCENIESRYFVDMCKGGMKLKELNIVGCYQLGDKALEALISTQTELERFAHSNSYRGYRLEIIEKLTSLKHIKIYRVGAEFSNSEVLCELSTPRQEALESLELFNNVNLNLREVESVINGLSATPAPLSLGHTAALAQETTEERQALYAQLGNNYKWIDKIHEYSFLANDILKCNSLRRSYISYSNKRGRLQISSCNNTSPPHVDKVINELSLNSLQTNYKICRPFGSNAVIIVNIGRILKAAIVFKGVMIEWVTVKDFDESLDVDDLWTESRYEVFRKVQEQTHSAMLHFFSPTLPDLAVKKLAQMQHMSDQQQQQQPQITAAIIQQQNRKIALHGLVPQVIIYRRSDTTEGIL